MNKIDISVEGGDDLDKLFVSLPETLRKEILPLALNAAATIVQKDAQQRINSNRSQRKPPGLARTIVVKVVTYDNSVVSVVGPTYLGVNHAHLVEFGHELIRLIKEADGSVRRVSIGFVPPHPFLRPAGDTTKSSQHAAIVKIVTEGLARFQATA